LRRRKPSQRVVDWLHRRDIKTIFVSVVTLAEIRRGAEMAPNPAKRLELHEWLDVSIRPLFEDRDIPIDENVALAGLSVIEAGRARGQTFAVADLLIGATALTYGLTVVTRDVRHYAPMGIPVFDPWAA
jgi:predicted nucleic acid-binding protein